MTEPIHKILKGVEDIVYRGLYIMLIVVLTLCLIGCDGSKRYALLPTSKMILSIDGVDYKLEPYSKENDITKGELDLLWDKNTNTTFLLTVTNNSEKSVSVKTSLATLIDNLGNKYQARNPKLIPRRSNGLDIGGVLSVQTFMLATVAAVAETLAEKEPSSEYKQAVNSQDIILDPNFGAQIIVNFSKLEDKTAHIVVSVPNTQNTTDGENFKWEYDVEF